ncbi:MAG: TolC family protein [Bryobacteraceae bacterium]
MRTLCVALCLGGSLFAQPAAGPITLDQALDEALQHNLPMLAERLNVQIADARIVQARLRPNPQLSFSQMYVNLFGTGVTALNSAGPTETDARLDWTFERGGKRARRVEVASEAKSVAELNLLNTVRQLRLDVENAFVDLLTAKSSVALAQENLKSLQGLVEINEARVKSGDLAEVELKRSRLAALQFQNSVRQAELRVRTSSTRLQQLLGRTPSPVFDVRGEFRENREEVTLDALTQIASELRPDLQATRKDADRAKADIGLQMAIAKSDYQVGAQYNAQYSYASGKTMSFFFQVPLPLLNRNQGEIERARRENQQLVLRTKALEQQISSEVRVAWEQYQTARQLLDTIGTSMLQQAREVRDTTEYSYRRGEASLVEFLDAQRAFNDTVQSYNDARGDYSRGLYLLEAVTGKGVRP